MNLKEAYFSGVEDDKRVFENDRKSDKNGRVMPRFVPLEEDVDKKIKNLKKEIENGEENDILEKQDNPEIGFSEEDGVAHIGPDFDKSPIGDNEDKKEDSIKSENNPAFFLPRSGFLRKIMSYANKSNDFRQSTREKGAGKDNIKTWSDSKVERNNRYKIGKELENQKFDEPTDIKYTDSMLADDFDDSFLETEE